jgi:hypothetical protein
VFFVAQGAKQMACHKKSLYYSVAFWLCRNVVQEIPTGTVNGLEES